jgi:thiamine-phosphate pyrophosphorylase
MTQSSSDGDSRRSGLTGRVRGFYAILDRDDEGLARRLVDPAGAGATVLQVRIKPGTTRAVLAAARMARAVTRQYGALLVINDRLDVALAVDADGVHLGQDDLTLADARAALSGRPMMIGVSTHDLAQVRAALAGGADYLGFGPVFATSTKANPDPVVGLDGLAAAAALTRAAGVPLVAIGGIGLHHGAAVAASGADAAAAIGAVNGADDPAVAGRTLAAHWSVRNCT